jgi:hypothetical protein
MIYLIGGAPRVGKTTLARMLLERKGVPFIPADVLANALSKTYPELEVGFGSFGRWDQIPEKFYPFFRKVVRGLRHHHADFTVEGDSFFPQQAHQLLQESKEEIKIKACFLGASATTLENIRKYALSDWVGELPEEQQQALPHWIVEKSQMFKTESEKYGIPYFDVATEREKTLEAAYSYLIKP